PAAQGHDGPEAGAGRRRELPGARLRGLSASLISKACVRSVVKEPTLWRGRSTCGDKALVRTGPSRKIGSFTPPEPGRPPWPCNVTPPSAEALQDQQDPISI